jgi:hypothetical protein
MARTPKKQEIEADPKRGDAILKRMLQTKPKPHKEMLKGERKGQAKRERKGEK